ncbi:PIN domain-containing protein [Shinella sumterensis]|uniref:PIN domain-containing protein n=1 Tax=Shinella sumterensis TaxID=1967501 RepID=UPI003F84CA97
MSDYAALLDANVLYPAPLRDLLIQLAQTNLFRARWSADIHREWIDALLRNEPSRDRTTLERTRDLMNRAVRDCLVTDYDALVPALVLPDAEDRHVLAAAIIGRCDVIVTQNLKDFPATALAPYGIEAQHPDEFLSYHLELAPGVFCESVRKLRARLKNPPYSVEDYLGTLTQQGLVATAAELEAFAALL